MSCPVAPIGPTAPTGSGGTPAHPPTFRTAISSPEGESPRSEASRNSRGATGATGPESQVSCPTRRPVEDRPEGGTNPAGKPQRRLSVTRSGGHTQYPALAPSCGRTIQQPASESVYLENRGVSA